ncbi:MAG TPA: ABC transporter permease [Chitinophagaceae bacterium]|nr:ABC transporter permease [Chitinophagaceae bacterium]
MNKIWLIIQREYLTRVKKKSFLLTTILVPIVIIGFYAAIIAIAVGDSTEKEKIAIIDESNLFEGKVPSQKDNNESITFDFISESKDSFQKKYADQGYTAYLYIPKLDIKNPKGIELHSQSTVSINVKNRVERTLDKAIESRRLLNENIDPEKYQAIKSNVNVDSQIDSEDGGKKSVEGVAYAVALAAGILIYMVLLIYGSMVMRGVMEEKTNRISEVIVSSVKPFQLMMGKIVGIGAVGITQFIIWIVLIGLLQLIMPLIFPAMSGQMTDQIAQAGAAQPEVKENIIKTISEGLDAIPVGLLLFSFLFYFLGGYLMYASLFAAIGSVSEDQQDAQQLIFPVMMPIILGFVILMRTIQTPNSGLAVFGSLFPLTSPIVMIGRIPFGVPWTQLVLSMLLLVGFFLFCTWLAGRIYRTGILMYGKKGSWKEMMKWAFRRG